MCVQSALSEFVDAVSGEQLSQLAAESSPEDRIAIAEGRHFNSLLIENNYHYKTTMCKQGRRHGFESGGTNSASEASRKTFFDPPRFLASGGQNIA